jgi:hypothetical protein
MRAELQDGGCSSWTGERPRALWPEHADEAAGRRSGRPSSPESTADLLLGGCCSSALLAVAASLMSGWSACIWLRCCIRRPEDKRGWTRGRASKRPHGGRADTQSAGTILPVRCSTAVALGLAGVSFARCCRSPLRRFRAEKKRSRARPDHQQRDGQAAERTARDDRQTRMPAWPACLRVSSRARLALVARPHAAQISRAFPATRRGCG